jgi:hypothetical protein
MTDKLKQAEEEPYNGWILRNVYFEDGEPLMHSEPESTQSQELFGKTEELEHIILRLQELTARTADMEHTILRLQELADYRLKLLTKMPSQWVGLTDDDIDEASESRTGCEKYAWVERVIRNAEAKLKEKNHVN